MRFQRHIFRTFTEEHNSRTHNCNSRLKLPTYSRPPHPQRFSLPTVTPCTERRYELNTTWNNTELALKFRMHNTGVKTIWIWYKMNTLHFLDCFLLRHGVNITTWNHRFHTAFEYSWYKYNFTSCWYTNSDHFVPFCSPVLILVSLSLQTAQLRTGIVYQQTTKIFKPTKFHAVFILITSRSLSLFKFPSFYHQVHYS